MTTQHTQKIRTIMVQAEDREADTGDLYAHLQARAPYLHSAIQLPSERAARLLADFVVRYIKHAPDLIDAINAIAEQEHIDHGVTPLLQVAVDYFLAPPDLIRGKDSLAALLEEAYLAHRLLEEINDRFISLGGGPLAPMDMTRANLIAHELIGEPFANELGQAVLFSADLLLSEYSFRDEAFSAFFARHKKNGWSAELSRWPCLAADQNISVIFSRR